MSPRPSAAGLGILAEESRARARERGERVVPRACPGGSTSNSTFRTSRCFLLSVGVVTVVAWAFPGAIAAKEPVSRMPWAKVSEENSSAAEPRLLPVQETLADTPPAPSSAPASSPSPSGSLAGQIQHVLEEMRTRLAEREAALFSTQDQLQTLRSDHEASLNAQRNLTDQLSTQRQLLDERQRQATSLQERLSQANATVEQLKEGIATLSQHQTDQSQQLAVVKDQRDAANQQLDALTQDLQAVRRRLAEREGALTTAQAQLRQLRADDETREKAKHQLDDELTHQRQLLDERQRQVATLQDRVAKFKSAQESLQAEHQQLAQTAASKDQELSKAQATIAQLADRITTLETNLTMTKEELQTDREQWQQANAKLSSELATTKDRLASANATIGGLQDELAAAKDELGTSQNNLKVLQQTNAKLTSQLGLAQDDLEGARTAIKRLRAEREDAEQKLTQRLAEMQGQATKGQETLGARDAAVAAKQKELEAAQKELKTVQQTTARLSDDLAAVNKELAATTEELNATQKELKALKQANAKLTDEVASAKDDLATSQAAIQQLDEKATQKELKTLKQAHAKLSDEFTHAQEAVKQLNGGLAKLNQVSADQNQRLASVSDQLVATQRERDSLIEELKDLRAHADERQAKLATIEHDNADLTAQLAELKTAHRNLETTLYDRTGALQQMLDQRTAQLAQANANHTRLTEEINAKLVVAQHQVTELTQRLAVSQEDYLRTLQEAEKLREASARLTQEEGQLKEMKAALKARDQELATLKANHLQFHDQVEGLQDRLMKSTQRARELATELELLRVSSGMTHAPGTRLPSPNSVGAQPPQSQEEPLTKLEDRLETGEGTTAPSAPSDVLRRAAPSASTDADAHSPRPSLTRAIPAAGDGSTIKVYGVSEELGFVVLYVKGIDWTKKGTRVLLDAGGAQPPLEVKITDINRWGLAVAYVQGTPPRPLPIKGGDIVLARPL